MSDPMRDVDAYMRASEDEPWEPVTVTLRPAPGGFAYRLHADGTETVERHQNDQDWTRLPRYRRGNKRPRAV